MGYSVCHLSRFTAIHLFGSPKECAEASLLLADFDMESTGVSISVVTDGGTWKDRIIRADVAYGDLMFPSTELISKAASNRKAPRVSNAQARQAARLIKKYERDIFFRSVISSKFSEETDDENILQFKCLTDTCPSGVTCSTISPYKDGYEFAERLPINRTRFMEVMQWASGVNHLQRRVPAFIERYNRAEERLVKILERLPQTIYVIDVYVRRK